MSIQSLILPLTLLAALASCSDSQLPQDTVPQDTERHPLGKADGVGSCEGSCGNQSDDGSCWCDDLCEGYGDCCADKVATCDAPDETACGGWLGDTCASDEFCAFDDAANCGFADASGVCAPKPEVCIQLFAPVCGCDGQTYSNSCHAAAAGVSVASLGACEVPPPFCGGFGGIQCPDGLECIDDPNDGCDPQNGGADCGGICVEPDPQECPAILCFPMCEFGVVVDDQGCDTCVCNDPPPPVDSCADSCDGQSQSGSCWCDDSCEGYGDCCDDFADECSAPGRTPASGACVKNSNDECQTDADCNAGGCGGELCFNPAESNGISTCECTTPTQVSGCGCVAGSCTWYNE